MDVQSLKCLLTEAVTLSEPGDSTIANIRKAQNLVGEDLWACRVYHFNPRWATFWVWCMDHPLLMSSRKPKPVQNGKIKSLLQRKELRDTLHRHSPGYSSAISTLKNRDRQQHFSFHSVFGAPDLVFRHNSPPPSDRQHKCGHTTMLCRLLPWVPATLELAWRP